MSSREAADRLRIALVHPHVWPDVRRGAERYLHDLAWHLATAGHEVHVITGTDGSPDSSMGPMGEQVLKLRHRLPGPLARRRVSKVDTFGLVALPTLVRRRYDAVHALTPTAAIAASLARQRVVYTILGHPTTDQMSARPLNRQYMVGAIRLASRPMALSRGSAEAAGELFGLEVGVLSPGVRMDEFEPDLAPRTGAPRVLFAADAGDARKGVDLAVAALAALLGRRPDARLVLAGPGDPSWCLDQQPARVRDAVDVVGVGTLADLPARYRASTVTLLPSRHEAFGLVLVESLACGTPVVCTPDGGMPEIVDDPLVGRVARSPSAPHLATALDEVIGLAADPEAPARCVSHARRWGWRERIGPEHVAVYRSLRRR